MKGVVSRIKLGDAAYGALLLFHTDDLLRTRTGEQITGADKVPAARS